MSDTVNADFWWAGILLEAFGTLISDFGMIMFRFATTKADESTFSQQFGHYALGLLCVLCLYPALDALAYSVAAQSIVSSCSGLAVAWNILLGSQFLGERLSVSRTVGAIVILAGTVGVGASGNHEDQVVLTGADYLAIYTRPAALIYYTVIFGFWVLACSVRFKFTDRRTAALLQAAFGGCIAGGSQFLTKAASSLLRDGFKDVLHTTEFWILLSLNVLIHWLGIYMLALSLRKLEALEGVALYEGCSILGGALSGMIVLQEGQGQPVVKLTFFGISMGVVLFGLLCVGRYPSFLGDGDEECSACVARRKGGSALPKEEKLLQTQARGEAKKLLPEGPPGGCCGFLCSP